MWRPRGVGGASVLASRRETKSFARPNQIKNFAFEWPVFAAPAQFFAEWILLNIEPLLGVALAVAQPMMPAAWLKFPFRQRGLARGDVHPTFMVSGGHR